MKKLTTEYLQAEFFKSTGIEWKNSQGEPDIDYVAWLENRLISQSLQPVKSSEESEKVIYEILSTRTYLRPVACETLAKLIIDALPVSSPINKEEIIEWLDKKSEEFRKNDLWPTSIHKGGVLEELKSFILSLPPHVKGKSEIDEQVKKLLESASYWLSNAVDIFNGSSGLNTDPKVDKYSRMVECAEQIEEYLKNAPIKPKRETVGMPSDEEIEKESEKLHPFFKQNQYDRGRMDGWQKGAKWMRSLSTPSLAEGEKGNKFNRMEYIQGLDPDCSTPTK